MSEQNIVEIKGLSKAYGKKEALKNVSLTLPRGRIIGLLGPNGSGKTTLIKILNGLLNEYQGEVRIGGDAPGVKTKSIVSYLPDKNYFASWMKGTDVLSLFSDFYQDFDRAKAEELMERLSIDKNQKIKAMSKGTIEKVELIMTMSRKAQLYVLDEPIGGVDPAARELILDTILNNYNEEGSILLSTHLITDVERIFDTVIFLKEGEVALCDDIDNIRGKYEKSVDELFREVFKC